MYAWCKVSGKLFVLSDAYSQSAIVPIYIYMYAAPWIGERDLHGTVRTGTQIGKLSGTLVSGVWSCGLTLLCWRHLRETGWTPDTPYCTNSFFERKYNEIMIPAEP